MEDGYYWARWADDSSANWQIVWVYYGQIYAFACNAACSVSENRVEFGDKIEIPEKYE